MAKPKGRGRPRKSPSPLPSDLEMEEDKFAARQTDILRLDGEDEDSYSEEEEALGLSDSEDYESDEDSEDEDTKIGRIAKQAKALEAKLRIARGEEEEGSEEEDGEREGGRQAAWGVNKRSYYGADTGDLEGSEAEEDAQDEEEEVMRLQREAAAALRPEDYGLSGDEGSSEEGEEEEEGEGRASGPLHVEEVEKDLSGLTEEQKRALVAENAQELTALIGELRQSLAEVRSRVGPLLKEVQEGELATAEGVSYLDSKHLLLLHYCTALVFYLLLKAEGRPVQNHPVIMRLVEIRAYLDKIKPIDKKLQYQLDKLLAAAQKIKAQEANGGGAIAGAGQDEEADIEGASGLDPLSYGPRPEALVPKVPGAAGAAGADAEEGGVYRPPKLNPISMELDEQRGPNARERREATRQQRRAERSTFVQELAAELAGAPEEERMLPVGMDTAAAIRERQRMALRDDVEEELMIRVPLSKEERKRLKASRRAGLSGKALLDDFADDIADIVKAADAGVDGTFSRHRASQKFGADLAAQAVAASRKTARSGDADLPSREPLHERRAKYDAVRAKQAAAAGGSDDEMPDEMGGGRRGKRAREAGEEDAFYQEAKAAAASKKSRRKEAYSYPELLPPVEDPTTTEARKITKDIEKNRGLTPHRRRDLKNPRKKNRVKFAKATVRRKGQVLEVRAGAAGAYGGEQTGIKARVSKSVKL